MIPHAASQAGVEEIRSVPKLGEKVFAMLQLQGTLPHAIRDLRCFGKVCL